MDIIERAAELLREVGRLRTPAFSGMGVIFYHSAAELPVVSLGHQVPFPFNLPVNGVPAIAKVLAAISDQSSPFHDGFHLVDAGANCLTKVAQFVSPPLPDAGATPTNGWPQGARQMAAQLSSGLLSVAAVGLLSGDEAVIYARTRVVISIKV